MLFRNRDPARFMSEVAYRHPGRFAIAGDFQRTSVLELGREQNDPERARIVAGIAAERPAMLISLGDHVFDGGSRRHWGWFDALTAPIREGSIPVLPIPGNHERWLWGRRNLVHYFSRFPDLQGRCFYSVVFGPLGMVFLDSTDRAGRSREGGEQRTWYEEQLIHFDDHPDIRGVLVFVHHPPYTNSTRSGDDLWVQRVYVPAFVHARKTLAMFAGHVHAYEHFHEQGKHFIVSGGGGGPRPKLSMGKHRRHLDLFDGPAIRDFHFLMVEPAAAAMNVQAIGLAKGARDFHAMDVFSLNWP
jgi:hypothetical protein